MLPMNVRQGPRPEGYTPTHERVADIERRLDEIERAVIAMYKRGFVGDSLSLVEMAPLLERVKLLALEVKQG